MITSLKALLLHDTLHILIFTSNRGFSYNTNPKIVEITPIRADILTS